MTLYIVDINAFSDDPNDGSDKENSSSEDEDTQNRKYNHISDEYYFDV